MIDQERAKKLLGAGVQAELVAATLGCEPSYISQLLSDTNFREAVVALRVASLTAVSERDAKIDSLEDTLIQKIEDALDYITRPRELISAFNVINGAKRRGAGVQQNTMQNNVVVNLILPTAVQQHFVTNTRGEVIEVDGKTSLTMPPAQLLREMADRKELTDGIQAEELRKLAQRLPSTILQGIEHSSRAATAAGIDEADEI